MNRIRCDRVRGTGEAGVTLLEVVVSMTIMSVVMAVFTTGFLAMYRSANRTEAMSVAQSQVTVAFQRLDKEIRYASAISAPGKVGSDWYVEYLTTTGVARCTQLRLDTSDAANVRLRLRSWDQGSEPPVWTGSPVLASNLSSAQPFYPDASANVQRLRVRVEAGGTSGASTAKALTDVTFTALNSDSAAAAGYPTICTEGRSKP